MKALKKETKKSVQKTKKKSHCWKVCLKEEEFFFLEIIFFVDTELYQVSYWVKKKINKTPPSPTFSSKWARDNLKKTLNLSPSKYSHFFLFKDHFSKALKIDNEERMTWIRDDFWHRLENKRNVLFVQQFL